MLKHLQLKNFKSWPTLDFKLAPITALFGSNSSGKSSIIQFLQMLKQTKDSTNTQAVIEFGDTSTSVELGSYRDAIYQHDITKILEWDLVWQASRPIMLADASKKKNAQIATSDEIGISASLSARGRQVITNNLSYTLNDMNFSLQRREGKSGYQLISSDEDRFKFVRSMGRPWDLPEPTKCFSFPDQAQTYFQNAQFLGLLENAYVEQVDNILHLGPLREDPKRQYSWSGSTPADVGPRGERTIEAILAATESKERRNLKYRSPTKPFQEMIALWLRKLGLIDSFRVEEVGRDSGLFRVYVRKSPASVETLITDVGFGVSQILPVITLLYFAKEGSTILIEQPEIHLHPHVQAGLADLVIATVLNRNLQIVIESHSEHFLHRLLRRVAERETEFGEIQKDKVQLYFCENVEGHSKINDLAVNMFGAIENWPKDFFGDQLSDMVAREKAAVRTRKALQAAK